MKHWIVGLVFGLLFAFGNATAKWNSWEDNDPMTNIKSYGVSSQRSTPIEPMSFPFRDVEAIVGISCDGNPYFHFTTTPVLDDIGFHSDGYISVMLRVRFDDKPPFRTTFSQKWGSERMTPLQGKIIFDSLLAHRTMLLELPWHTQGNVVFRFDLTGSRKLYQSTCAAEISE